MQTLTQMINDAFRDFPVTPETQRARTSLEEQLTAALQKELDAGLSQEAALMRAALQISAQSVLTQEKRTRQYEARRRHFETRYPHYVRCGFLAIVLIPFVFLILMFSMESKLVFLSLWIVSIIIIATFLICIEYIHYKFQQPDAMVPVQENTADLSQQDAAAPAVAEPKPQPPTSSEPTQELLVNTDHSRKQKEEQL